MSPYLDEAECLRIIAAGEMDATELLLDQLPGIERRFQSVDRAIRRLLADVRETFPDAQYYTASGGFHLMLGSPHSERGSVAQPQPIALSGRAAISDGDF